MFWDSLESRHRLWIQHLWSDLYNIYLRVGGKESFQTHFQTHFPLPLPPQKREKSKIPASYENFVLHYSTQQQHLHPVPLSGSPVTSQPTHHSPWFQNKWVKPLQASDWWWLTVDSSQESAPCFSIPLRGKPLFLPYIWGQPVIKSQLLFFLGC